MIEAVRVIHSVLFGTEEVMTIQAGKFGAEITALANGIGVSYTQTNPNTGLKLSKSLFVPYGNIRFITESPTNVSSPDSGLQAKTSTNKDKARP